MKASYVALPVAAALLIGAAALRLGSGPRWVSAQAPPVALEVSSGFKVTFGLKQKAHGRAWVGGLRNSGQTRSVSGWHLDTSDTIVSPDRWNITLRTAGGDIPEKGVILDVLSPPEQPVVIYSRGGDDSFRPAQVPYGAIYNIPELDGDVTVERVPIPRAVTGPEYEDDDPALLKTREGEYWMAWVAYRTLSRTGDYIEGGDQIMLARSRDGQSWSASKPITEPGDHFRVSLAQDGRGRLWCVYAAQKQMETGNFDLYARVFDGRAWSDEQRLTFDPRPDIFHRLAATRDGHLYLVWMGYRPGPGNGPAQSEILLRVWNGERWGDEINVSQSADNDWEPAIAVDRSGRAWIAWDSYRASEGPANYDVLLRSYSSAGLGPVRPVSDTRFAEMRADVAVDGSDRVWLAWEEGGVNWGKDTGYENPKHRIQLRKGGSQIYGPSNSRTYPYRRPRVAVVESDRLKEPAAPLADAYPASLQPNLFQNPRLGVDGSGRVWVLLRQQLVAKGRNAGHLFDFYATTLAGPRWINPILLPGSTGRQDTVVTTAPGAANQMVLGVVGDGRKLPVPLGVNHDVAALVLDATGLAPAAPELKEFSPSMGQFPVTHPEEAAQVAQVRNHRLKTTGATYKIVRGDLHRHTEISMDGAVDGSLWDLYRYAIDAAAFDFIAVTDHNYGAWLDTDEPETKNTDDIYQWWRTQKSADLFYVPGRFVPLYGYERSINFPLGHRNIIHVRRGVFSLRVPKLHIAERPDLIEKDAQALWAYLRATDGVALPHTSATTMGTDWRLRDDALEPVTELYQGDRNAYEDEGAPRAALSSSFGPGAAGRSPFQRGLIWNALGAGYKMGFIASSDHFSTHISYANLLTPDRATTREDIQQALRERRTYASTDNIVLDFFTGETVQGGEIRASESPIFHVRAVGTEAILRVEIVKNNRIIYTKTAEVGGADKRRLEFDFRDKDDFSDTSMSPTSQIRDWSRPETGIRPRPQMKAAYYYVRVIQRYSEAEPEREGEIAWSSPIFVR
jgi:hypothetical protein